RLVAEHPEHFRRVVAANTGLPTGDARMPDAFFAWQRFSQDVPELPVGGIVRRGTVGTLPDDVVAAYEAPFPDERYKEGPRQMPALVPTRPDDPAADANRRAWARLRDFDRPFLCAFSDGDPITRGADRQFLEAVPGAAGQPHVTIEGAGHFLQEDKGTELADVVVAFVARTTPEATCTSGAT
ncbi:MAG TPA: haloalkane dehalogenase, partial [Acidimicrobiales bacterium]|nr:haloalkane dehalogenase [Acidimicrobiales bacterium]